MKKMAKLIKQSLFIDIIQERDIQMQERDIQKNSLNSENHASRE